MMCGLFSIRMKAKGSHAATLPLGMSNDPHGTIHVKKVPRSVAIGLDSLLADQVRLLGHIIIELHEQDKVRIGRRFSEPKLNGASSRLLVLRGTWMVENPGLRAGKEIVKRGAEFLTRYLPQIGMSEFVVAGAELIHFTGFEKRVGDILIQDPLLRMLGSLLGSADIIAQMSDRCYLEKCRDRLYPEFVAGGIAVKHTGGGDEVVFKSGDDLVRKTPAFFYSAVNRLEYELGGAYNYAATHFGGFNLYMHAATKNVHFAKQIGVSSAYALRRSPPDTMADAV